MIEIRRNINSRVKTAYLSRLNTYCAQQCQHSKSPHHFGSILHGQKWSFNKMALQATGLLCFGILPFQESRERYLLAMGMHVELPVYNCEDTQSLPIEIESWNEVWSRNEFTCKDLVWFNHPFPLTFPYWFDKFPSEGEKS